MTRALLFVLLAGCIRQPPAPMSEPTGTYVDEFHGLWRYAGDPTTAAGSTRRYGGSTLTFRPDGTYTLRTDAGTMEGSWEPAEAGDEGLRLHTASGDDLTVIPRREGGRIVGLEVRDGTGARYYELIEAETP